MGTGTEFDTDEGVADPNVEARLRILCGLPSADAALLARLIAGIAKTDIAGCAKDWDEERRKARRAALPLLKRLHAAAAAVVHLESAVGPRVAPDAIGDLISLEPRGDAWGAGNDLLALARRLRTLELTTLPKVPSGRRLNEQMVRIVQAVAAYFDRKGKEFTGEPRRSKTDKGSEHIVKSEQAKLTQSVLQIMQFNVPTARLATLMRKARRAEAIRASRKL